MLKMDSDTGITVTGNQLQIRYFQINLWMFNTNMLENWEVMTIEFCCHKLSARAGYYEH